MMYLTATRWLAILGAISTLVLMVTMARPWGNNDAFQDLSGYALLLLMAAWATLPYLVVFFMAKWAVPVKGKEIAVFIGALILFAGGLAVYVDAMWLHPDPQGGLAFIAVPLYQGIVLGVLAGLLLLVQKRKAP